VKRSRILILLSALLVLSIGYAWYATPRQARVPVPRPAESDPVMTAMETMEESFREVADLNLPGGQISKYQPPVNDLFGSIFPPPKKMPIVRRPPRPKPKPAPAPKKIVRLPKPVQRPTLPKVSVLGYLNKGQETTVFLTTGSGTVYLVKDGESFGDGLRVASINAGRVEIVKPATGQSLVLSLGETRSQRLPDDKYQSGRPQYEPPPETGTQSAEGEPSATPALEQQKE